jgi:hypothetical protein
LPDPPPTLFHYTRQAGLLGVLRADSLWATKIHYLNDSSEYEFALQIASDILKQRLDNEQNPRERGKIECLRNNISGIERLNVCVVSFSEDSDLLSQWRAYGGTKGGYALGFYTSRLLEQSAEQGFFLRRCVYEEQEQRELIADLIQESLGTEFNTEEGYVDPDRPRTLITLPTDGDFQAHLATLAPILKNKSFKEEREWRLISKAVSVLRMSFREGYSMLIPYVEFNLGADKAKYLASVTVGPAPHMGLSKNATSMLLAHWEIGNVKVAVSEVPYRNW